MPGQYKAFWSIPNAGPSVSTFHTSAAGTESAQGIANAIRAFFSSWASWLPNDVSVSFDSEVLFLGQSTGELTDSFPVTPPAGVTGAQSGVWPAGAGARLVWDTGTIREGRRVRGSTFMVPLTGSAFTNTGRVANGPITLGGTSATTLIDALVLNTTPLAVWSRPRPGIPGDTSLVVQGSTSPIVATLRGRKY